MEEEIYIEQILQSYGFKVEKIEESEESSPDFLVQGVKDNYLIELKSKFDNPVETKKRREVLGKGEIAEKHDTTGRKNTVSKVIRDSVKQLSSVANAVDYKLIWLHAVERHQDMKLEQFKSTLYGSVDIFDLDEFSGNLIPCYYFNFNEFFSAASVLDGAVVSTSEKAALCLNTFSPKYNELKHSELSKIFGKGVVDPLEQEQNGNAFVIDTNINRNDESELIRFLNKKYKRNKLQKMVMGFHSASVLVPSDSA